MTPSIVPLTVLKYVDKRCPTHKSSYKYCELCLELDDDIVKHINSKHV